MRRSFGALAIAALMATAVAIPVAANAEINGHNCIGVAASATEPTVNGPRVAEWNRKNPPGAMARRIAEVRADSDYGCVPE